MRLRKLIWNDIKFQFKYGFYFLYFAMSLLYVGIIYALPVGLRGKVAAITIFTDPAALGLFFMGAIVLFEKSERVLNSLAVSPVKLREYIGAKVVSLGFVSTLAGMLVSLFCVPEQVKPLPLLVGIFAGSVLFSLAGLVVATRIGSLNQFVLFTVPFELVLFLPPIAYLFGVHHVALDLHPGVMAFKLILDGISAENTNVFLLLAGLMAWTVPFWLWAEKNTAKMFRELGGVRL